jgi:hypothetical protein
MTKATAAAMQAIKTNNARVSKVLFTIRLSFFRTLTIGIQTTVTYRNSCDAPQARL